ncbi:hypothetical protein BGZ95_002256 [Linnemannia exigua]|uniref:Uncharacterized protein n=1 Tax=Linnemannia exigua TaxID=604196 RepID=A0AAD4D5Q3_9FUNG|nr:hypothetical protein BGZ95_002256 [Linnemannia exigua]
MRFSTVLASVSLAAVASAGTISLAEFSSNSTSSTFPSCYECAMNTFIRSVPACQRRMLDNINSEILLNDKEKACLCPVAALAIKPETLNPCAGAAPMCATNFLTFTSDIFDYIGKNNNCSSFGVAAVTTPGSDKTTPGSDKTTPGSDKTTPTNGAHGLVSSDKVVALGVLVAMAAASLIL